MGYRINERNSGNWTLDGEPKIRKTKIDKKLSKEEKELAYNILNNVYNVMDEDGVTGTCTDGGRFVLSLTNDQMCQLSEILKKL